jgi:hypothetical protein
LVSTAVEMKGNSTIEREKQRDIYCKKENLLK